MNNRLYKNIMKKSLFLALIIGVASTSLFAQSRHYNSQSLAMGSGGTAYVDGFHANFINPANLMLDIHRPKTQIGLMNFGVKAGGSLANLAVYNKYLTTGRLIAGETRTNMLNEWFGSSSSNERELSATFSMAPLGVSYRGANQAFSVASRVRITEDFAINKGMAELMTYGLDSDKFSSPTPVNFSSNTVAFAEISVGYARELNFINIPDLFFAKDIKLYVGAAPKYLYGVYTADLDFNSSLQIDDGSNGSNFTINHEFNYSLQTIGELSRQLQAYETAYNQDNNAKFDDYVEFGDVADDLSSPQATGFGLDLGATVEMDISSVPIPLFVRKKKTLRVSMSITDMGKLTYDQDPSSVYADGNFSYQGAGDDDEFSNFFDNLSDSLQNDVYGQFNSEQTAGITYNLPSMYNFGASLEMGKLMLALDYGVGFNGNGLNSERSALSLGAQYRLLGFIPIRVGSRVGGYSSAAYSAGIGLDFNFLEFTVGVSNVANSENSGSSAGVAWSGLLLRF
ncbi:MAG: hypothetical protein JJ953_11120 [Gracilimonas sp.]|uniref:DUF5723 family protein n=2 Tax=Balneolaceae TaxID=1813606 RepID=UPI001B0E1BC0|nr:DUF5723 family protein [Gracilimonas sp.]MBO6586647.1 hypothetical protein [Gracilimonas sp.]MBO6615304.1 hypothetical protein [Gracilimonas sp.]